MGDRAKALQRTTAGLGRFWEKGYAVGTKVVQVACWIAGVGLAGSVVAAAAPGRRGHERQLTAVLSLFEFEGDEGPGPGLPGSVPVAARLAALLVALIVLGLAAIVFVPFFALFGYVQGGTGR